MDPYFGPWTPLNKPIHESHTESPGGNISYTTACSFSLFHLSAGFLMMKMKMYPNISGINLSNTKEALTVGGLDLVNGEFFSHLCLCALFGQFSQLTLTILRSLLEYN